MATRAKPATVTIRPAQENDLDDVAAIERAVFNDPWSRRSFVDLVGQQQVAFLVAVAGKAVVGYASRNSPISRSAGSCSIRASGNASWLKP